MNTSKQRSGKKRTEVVVVLGVVFLSLLFLGPSLISNVIRSNFLAMRGDYHTESQNFAVSAQVLWADTGHVTMDVLITNKTDEVISGVRANALLDEGFEPVLVQGSAYSLYFYQPGLTRSWSKLLRDPFGLPTIKLAPRSADNLSQGQSAGLSMSRTFGVVADELTAEQKAALLTAPIRIKIWHEGGIEFLTVTPEPVASSDEWR